MTKQKALKAPFPYFGGKSRIASEVWKRFGEVTSYVEPFCGSAAMLLAAPSPARMETINDADGFVANFWRAAAWAPEEVARWADWPVNEADLEARHSWLVNRSERLRWALEDPDFFDAKIAGWWVWGACAWIGDGWCSGKGPHVGNGAHIVDNRQLPSLGDAGRDSAGVGINRKLPCIDGARAGVGINLAVDDGGRGEFILGWMLDLQSRLRDVRVACGDWRRVMSGAVLGTSRSARSSRVAAVFLDPPYAEGKMDYSAGGMGTSVAQDVAAWCLEHGDHPRLRIALCGHVGEHDALEEAGWSVQAWKRGKGYGSTASAKARREEAIWYSPHCLPAEGQLDIEAAE